MKPAAVIYQVRVTRTETVDVFVEGVDPVAVRAAAVELAEFGGYDSDIETEAVAYSLSKTPNERFWRGGEDGTWVYPETSMFEEGQ